MVFINHKEGTVEFIHYSPFDDKHGLGKTKEQLDLEGVLVSAPPASIPRNGKQSIMKYSTETKKIYYEYIDIPDTEEDTIKKDLEMLKLENAELMMKSAMTDMNIETVKNENAEMMFRLASIEMGGVL